MKQTMLRRMVSLALSLLLLAAVPTALAQAEPRKINLFEYFEGSDLDLTPYKGKALFLNFFTEWCPYCMEEMDSIKKVFETYSQDELQIILVHCWSGEDASNTERVKERYGLEEMTFFEDETMSIAEMVGLQGFPTSIFSDKDGFVTQVSYALSYDQMAEAIEEMDVAKAEAKPAEDGAPATGTPEADTQEAKP